ncbi:MAG TPA: helix-hairpin-helix domain-containing protein [Planctomycetaceae bacterium]|nr:helix-hairpin-helix domain-containing protein [Planctomycetaceae bacterium]
MTEAARLTPIAESYVADDDSDAGRAAGAPAGGNGSAAHALSETPPRRAPADAGEAEVLAPNGTSDAVLATEPPAGSTDVEPGSESHFGLRRNDQLVIVAMLSATLVFSGLYWALLSGWGLQPVEIERLPERQFALQLDINAATWVEWMQLPGIGETLSRRIVADREQNGPFAGIDDLQRVRGIGPKTVERIRPWLREPGGPE